MLERREVESSREESCSDLEVRDRLTSRWLDKFGFVGDRRLPETVAGTRTDEAGHVRR